jgi:hypothetical protein
LQTTRRMGHPDFCNDEHAQEIRKKAAV